MRSIALHFENRTNLHVLLVLLFDILGLQHKSEQGMAEMTTLERRFKVVVLGSSGVGKTCLSLRFVRGCFEEQMPTVGAAYLTKSVRLRDSASGEMMSFVYELWDSELFHVDSTRGF